MTAVHHAPPELLAPLPLGTDRDVALARRRTKEVAVAAGVEDAAAARLAAAVSELARNAVQHGGGGELGFELQLDPPARLMVAVRDHGPGVGDVDAAIEALGGNAGLARAQRLTGSLRLATPEDGGTLAVVSMPIAPAAVRAMRARGMRSGAGPAVPAGGVRGRAGSEASAREELARLREELLRVEQELEETNRGVVAVYAELEDKAEQLRSASEVKSRFLSNVSHEFRTPLGSIIALTGLLLDSPLGPEQQKQVRFIAQAARELTALVDDLLDLARVEAGRIPINDAPFDVGDLLRHLRGTLAPLIPDGPVALVFAEPPPLPTLVSDQLRLGQVVRNFVSNALKFTERGSVTVSARVEPADRIPSAARLGSRVPQPFESGQYVVITVADTGIGIAPADQERIFEEFVQVEGPLQTRVKGTGLGLPLARRLAALLGGGVWLDSEPGAGSTFSVAVPVREIPASLEEGSRRPAGDAPAAPPEGGAIVIADDDELVRYVLRGALRGLGRPVVEAPGGEAALAAVRDGAAAALVLDLEMPDLQGTEVLRRLRADPATTALPVVIHTGRDLDAPTRSALLEAAQAIVPKGDSPEPLVATVRDLLPEPPAAHSVGDGRPPREQPAAGRADGPRPGGDA